MENQEHEKREEYAYVLDFMLSGKSFSNRAEPLAQVIGEEWFTLLEVTPKPEAKLSIGERVYIGKNERDKIMLIKTRITYDELTQTAKSSLPSVVSSIVKQGEKRFIDFFNNAGPLNIREHSLELLPGVGKKHLESILKIRSEKPFESFADITARIPLLQDPAKLITERIEKELIGEERFYLFVKPYKKRAFEPGR
jgi:putative nucleotide binding protein